MIAEIEKPKYKAGDYISWHSEWRDYAYQNKIVEILDYDENDECWYYRVELAVEEDDTSHYLPEFILNPSTEEDFKSYQKKHYTDKINKLHQTIEYYTQKLNEIDGK